MSPIADSHPFTTIGAPAGRPANPMPPGPPTNAGRTGPVPARVAKIVQTARKHSRCGEWLFHSPHRPGRWNTGPAAWLIESGRRGYRQLTGCGRGAGRIDRLNRVNVRRPGVQPAVGERGARGVCDLDSGPQD